MMSALRYPRTALKLLSTMWRSPNKFYLIRPTDRAALILPSCNCSSSAIPKEDKAERNRQQEEDSDPFGLGDVVNSKEGNILIQGFYPGPETGPARPHQQPEVAAPPPPATPVMEEVDVKKQSRLAEYDDWLHQRQVGIQSSRSEVGEADTFRQAHFGKVRIDSDNRPVRPPPQFQRSMNTNDRSRREDYSLPLGKGQQMQRERRDYQEYLRRQQHPDESDQEPLIETIEASDSVRMRASDFLSKYGGRRISGEEGDDDQRGKIIIEKIIKPRRGSEMENPEDCQAIQEDPMSLDSHTLPKSFTLPDYNAITELDMWNILKHCIVFQNDFLLAINKPVGVPCHSKAVDCRHFIIQFQKRFADLAKCEKIYPLHRLDKETTGVLLFAKDPKVASVIKKKFAERQVHKVYLAATKQCPTLPEGTIKIPIGEGKIPGTDNKYRQVLRPDLREYGIKPTTRSAVEAITHYKVLQSIKDAAFLEIEPVTGFKHQIRVHLGMGLGCPIIGDHKYSHRDRLAPQRLHPFVLHRIKVKQSKAREIPLHLHCQKISFTLPKEFTDSTEPVYIHATIPIHMKYTLKRLALIG